VGPRAAPNRWQQRRCRTTRASTADVSTERPRAAGTSRIGFGAQRHPARVL